MKFLKFVFLVFCFGNYFLNTLFAQEIIETGSSKIDAGKTLPPLIVMIDSAIAHNATIKYIDQGILEKKYDLESERKSWTKNFGLQADIRYGTFDNFSTNTAEGQSPSILATRSNQTNYGVGAYLKLPLYDFVNHKNLINASKNQVAKAESMAEIQRDEVRQMVIRQYNDLILQQKIVKIRSKDYNMAKINLEMVEKEFRNGVVTISEYSRISGITSGAEADYEAAKSNLISIYMILEELVGFRFNIQTQ